MTPGLMSCYGSLTDQFDQIMFNFRQCLIELLGGQSALSEEERAKVVQNTVLKAILYVSKKTALTAEL